MSDISIRDERSTELEQIKVDRARLDAREQYLLASLASDCPAENSVGDPDKQWIREEIACVLRIPCAAVTSRLVTATALVDDFPATLMLLESGEISFWHAKTLVEKLFGVPAVIAAKVEKRVLARAPLQTLGNFARSIARAITAYDPVQAEEQHQNCREERRVVIRHVEHGMTEL